MASCNFTQHHAFYSCCYLTILPHITSYITSVKLDTLRSIVMKSKSLNPSSIIETKLNLKCEKKKTISVAFESRICLSGSLNTSAAPPFPIYLTTLRGVNRSGVPIFSLSHSLFISFFPSFLLMSFLLPDLLPSDCSSELFSSDFHQCLPLMKTDPNFMRRRHRRKRGERKKKGRKRQGGRQDGWDNEERKGERGEQRMRR